MCCLGPTLLLGRGELSDCTVGVDGDIPQPSKVGLRNMLAMAIARVFLHLFEMRRRTILDTYQRYDSNVEALRFSLSRPYSDATQWAPHSIGMRCASAIQVEAIPSD